MLSGKTEWVVMSLEIGNTRGKASLTLCEAHVEFAYLKGYSYLFKNW